MLFTRTLKQSFFLWNFYKINEIQAFCGLFDQFWSAFGGAAPEFWSKYTTLSPPLMTLFVNGPLYLPFKLSRTDVSKQKSLFIFCLEISQLYFQPMKLVQRVSLINFHQVVALVVDVGVHTQQMEWETCFVFADVIVTTCKKNNYLQNNFYIFWMLP